MLVTGKHVNSWLVRGFVSGVLFYCAPASVFSQQADSLLPISPLRFGHMISESTRDSSSSIVVSHRAAADRTGELTGAIVGGVAGAVFANLLYCMVQDSSCGTEGKPIIGGFLVGAVLGAGFGSAADD